MRVLLGLMRPDAGTVQRDEGATIGYVPQRVHFDPTLPLTVRRLMVMTSWRPEKDIKNALAETQVGHLLDASVSQLSGGELQRVLLARARSCTCRASSSSTSPCRASTTPARRSSTGSSARSSNAGGCGVLLVSHDLHIVMASTDRVVCLNRHVCCTGAPQEVVGHAEFRRLFGPGAASSAPAPPRWLPSTAMPMTTCTTLRER